MADLKQSQSLCLGVLASHTGTNFQAILDRCLSGELPAHIGVVISNNSGSLALRRARHAHIPAVHLSGKTHPVADDLDAAMVGVLTQHQVDVVAMAGYMKKLGPRLLSAFDRRIINIHPSLLPAFGGKGMYGLRIHEAVIASGARFTGVTVHRVNEEYDQGPILLQEVVPVLPGESPEALAARVLCVEHRLYPAAIRYFAKRHDLISHG